MPDDQRSRPADGGPAPRSLGGDTEDGTAHVGPTLLDHLADLETGRRLRDEGIDVARAATHTGWRLHVDQVIDHLASSGVPFTAEDVRVRAGDPLGSAPSALGAAIGTASRRGLIEPVGFVLATRPQAHARPIRLWQGVGA